MPLSEAEIEIFGKLDDYFNTMYPTNRDGPFWAQEPYKGDLLAICEEAYRAGARIGGDQISDHLNGGWRQKRSDEQWKDVMASCRAWDEWQYVWKKQQASRD